MVYGIADLSFTISLFRQYFCNVLYGLTKIIFKPFKQKLIGLFILISVKLFSLITIEV